MFIDVLENRQAEGHHPVDRSGTRAPVNRPEYLVNTTLEQFVLVAEMRVEGRSADVGAIEDLLHRNRAIRLLVGKTNQRLPQRCLRPPDSPVARFPTILTRCPVSHTSRSRVLHSRAIQVYAYN